MKFDLETEYWYNNEGSSFKLLATKPDVEGYLPILDSDGSYSTVYALYVTPVTPVYPERWINVYPWGVSRNPRASRRLLDEIPLSFEDCRERIAIIHLAKDGTLTLEEVK